MSFTLALSNSPAAVWAQREHKKVLLTAGTLLVTALLAAGLYWVNATRPGWYTYNATGQRFYIPEGSHFRTEGPTEIDGAVYLFDDDGWLVRDGFGSYAGHVYLADADGRVLTGVQTADGAEYALDEATGELHRGLVTTDAGTLGYDGHGFQLFGMQSLDGTLYCFGADGVLQTGWIENGDGTLCYAGADGALCRGLQEVEGRTYYFLPADGTLQYGVRKVDGINRCFDTVTGALQRDTFVTLPYGTYCTDSEGVCLQGWQTMQGRTYHFAPNGKLSTGYTKVDGELYYFSEDGVLRTGFQSIDDKLYYFGEDGAIHSGYYTWEGADRLFDDHGQMLDGWQTIVGTTYYYDKGIKQTGDLELDGNVYHLGSDGVLHTGWCDLAGKRYYYDEFGNYLTGWQKVDKNLYHFDDNGVMTVNTTLDGYQIDMNGVAAKRLTSASTVQGCFDYVRSYLRYLRIPSDTPENMLQYALVNHRGACYHYATLFNYVLNQAGIENDIIWGHNPKGGTHVWNRLRSNGLIWDSCNGYRGITEATMAAMGFTW